MKYVAPKAEVVEFDAGEVLFLSALCIIFDPMNPGCKDKLPDFYE